MTANGKILCSSRARRGRSAQLMRKAKLRRLIFEQFEPRLLLAASWQNPGQPLDVNDDLRISPLDVLIGANALNEQGSRTLGSPDPHGPDFYYDVNGDGSHSPLDVLLVVNAVNAARPLPLVRLLNDTARDGATNRDVVTRDPRLEGFVAFTGGMTSVDIQVNEGPIQSLTFSTTEHFVFDPGLALDGSADGEHTVRVRRSTAVNSDDDVTLTFTLDTTAPTTPTLDLDPLFDSPPLGDRTTTLDNVSLVGQTSAGATVQLVETSSTATADAQGRFAFADVTLVAGANVFTVAATDAAGNTSQSSNTITRGTSGTGVDDTPPTITLDSPAQDFRTNSNITITGQVTDNASGAETLLAQVDLNDVVQVPFDSEGRFTFTTSLPLTGAADGQHLIRFRATDSAGNLSPLISLSWRLDTTPPTVSSEATGTGLDATQLVRARLQRTNEQRGVRCRKLHAGRNGRRSDGTTACDRCRYARIRSSRADRARRIAGKYQLSVDAGHGRCRSGR